MAWMRSLHCLRWIALGALGLALAGGAGADELALSGIVGGKAVLVINNGAPRLVAVGKSTPEGIRLLAIKNQSAEVEFEGRRYVLPLGARVVRQISKGEDRPGINGLTSEEARKILALGSEITIDADDRGHFRVAGEMNGHRVSMLVDTGATTVALGLPEARRLGIPLDDASQSLIQTAGGTAKAWRVVLKSLKVGSIRFENVEAMVSDAEIPALLGMNVLNKMEMRRDGHQMRLKKKY